MYVLYTKNLNLFKSVLMKVGLLRIIIVWDFSQNEQLYLFTRENMNYMTIIFLWF